MWTSGWRRPPAVTRVMHRNLAGDAHLWIPLAQKLRSWKRSVRTRRSDRLGLTGSTVQRFAGASSVQYCPRISEPGHLHLRCDRECDL